MPKGRGYKYDGSTKGHGSVGGAKSTAKFITPTDVKKNQALSKQLPANANTGIGRLAAYKKKGR